MIKENDKENDAEIAFSGIVHRQDCNCMDMIAGTNKTLKSYSASVCIGFIHNPNIDGSSLNRSKLPLNRKGDCLLAKNMASYVKLKIYFQVGKSSGSKSQERHILSFEYKLCM